MNWPHEVNWGGEGYGDYAGYMTSKKASYGENLGYQKSNEDSTAATGERKAADTTVQQAETSPTSLPLYKALYSTGLEGTNAAYDSAKSATRLRSNMAGFGYSSPTAEGADTGLESARASDVAKVGPEAELEAIQPSLQGAGMQYGAAGNLDRTGADYYGTAGGMTKQRLATPSFLRSMLGSTVSGASQVAAAYAGRPPGSRG